MSSMKRASLVRAVYVASAAGLLALGCGLISKDIASVTYPLPKKSYTFDSSSFGATGPAGPFTLACGSALPPSIQDCCSIPMACTPPDRTTACESNVCTVHQLVKVVQVIDFRKDVPQQFSSASSLADVSLKSLNYEVTTNTLNIPVPVLQIYLAPMGVTSPSDPQAKIFGSVPPFAAGELRSGDVMKEPDEATADATFATFASNLTAPFNILVATTVVSNGTPVPSGALTVAVTGTFKAQLF
jgi:hypothetical protein